jgi:hypothetical protein
MENRSVTSHPGVSAEAIGLDAGIANAQQAAPHTVKQAPQPTAPNVQTADGIEGTLRSMNVDQLKKWAADNEIPLGSAKSKDDLIKVILANR